jgi:hydroxymethylglutaryl-CoA synthase
MFSNEPLAGISAMSVYLPRFRVCLEDWCDWTGNSWNKVQTVVGHSFRVFGDHENVYTMAANAVLRLIQQNQIDPQSIGFLGFGTESSRDNSAGAVIIRGMVDRALEELGLPRLSRNLEIPEFKHACLGGIYALKNAVRYVSFDGSGRKAIVVASDVAQYERGSSGEQTQGAGAVAMLVEDRARLLGVDLRRAGSVSDYRGPDFRKPLNRYLNGYHGIKGINGSHGINGINGTNGTNGSNGSHGLNGTNGTNGSHGLNGTNGSHGLNGLDGINGSNGSNGKRIRFSDFPVFSGKYSTFAYIDETVHAVEEMLRRLDVSAGKYYESVRGLFFHRPYHQMPIQAMSFLYVRGLARGNHHHGELRDLCLEAGVSCQQLVNEARSVPDLYASVVTSREQLADPYKATSAVAAILRKRASFRALLEEKMSLGSKVMSQMGNLYTAALPAWLAAGLEEAARNGVELEEAPMVAVGYGSGDAAEAIPIRAPKGWQQAASRIGIEAAVAEPIDLTRSQYEALHDGYALSEILYAPKQEFVITHVGERYEQGFQDLAVEYYKYVS